MGFSEKNKAKVLLFGKGAVGAIATLNIETGISGYNDRSLAT